MSNHATIPVSPETKEVYDKRKQQVEEASTYDELLSKMAEEELDVSWEETEIEKTEERVERTRANLVAILEAVDKFDLTEDVLDIVETLSQQDMLAKNQDIIDHLLAKSKADESLNEVDRLLARILIETEQERDVEQSPAAEIAAGLFAGTDSTTAERRETKSSNVSNSTSLDDTPPGETSSGVADFEFDGVEGAEIETEATDNDWVSDS